MKFDKEALPLVTAGGTAVAAYGVFWSVYDSLNFPAGNEMFAILLSVSLLTGSTSYFAHRWRRAEALVRDVKAQQLADAKPIAGLVCPFAPEGKTTCPVGLVEVHLKAKDTLRTSLERPNSRFDWLGLSAFNVIHNNLDAIRSKYKVNYRFSILDPENQALQQLTDEYYQNADDKLQAKDLSRASRELLSGLEAKASNIEVQTYDSLPTFRLAIIDGEFVQASFYQRGGDVLERPQLEFRVEKEDPLSIGNWLVEFHEIMTKWNTRLQPSVGNNGSA